MKVCNHGQSQYDCSNREVPIQPMHDRPRTTLFQENKKQERPPTTRYPANLSVLACQHSTPHPGKSTSKNLLSGGLRGERLAAKPLDACRALLLKRESYKHDRVALNVRCCGRPTWGVLTGGQLASGLDQW